MRTILAMLSIASSLPAAELKLTEALPKDARVSVEVNVLVAGDMILPGQKDRLAVNGTSKHAYDERSLTPDDADAQKLVRIYRTIDIIRTVGDRKQTADIRKDVRRLVVLRTEKAKSPFSPDGPLMWGEIDVVKNDLFAPVLAEGLLPNKTVKEGDTWTASAAAVRELTDLEKVSEGTLTVTFVGVVNFDGKDRARLSVAGVLKGVDDNGPARHTIDGTAYWDLDSSLLSYLSVKGSHELLDGDGKTSGRIDGRFTMTRKLSENPLLADDAILKLSLKPNAENTRLLFENKEQGLSFVHPRRWHLGTVQGTQVTLNGPNGAGILITKENAKTLPTADAFLKESQDFLAKEKSTISEISKPTRTRDDDVKIDRFGFDANLANKDVRLEYAVISAKSGGATLAARFPKADAKELVADWDVLLKDLAILK